jgi:hypothetical protein
MSKQVHNQSHTTHDSTDQTGAGRPSVQTKKTNLNNEAIINSLTGYETNLGDQLEKLEREAELQARQIELSECLEFVAQLVDLFKHTIVTCELQNQNDWHSDTRHQLQQYKGVTGNRLLDEKIEKIAISKGLTKQQWTCLLYMAINTGETVEISNVSKKHLKKVHDKALRLLEDDEQDAVLALVNSIEKYMSKTHFTEK